MRARQGQAKRASLRAGVAIGALLLAAPAFGQATPEAPGTSPASPATGATTASDARRVNGSSGPATDAGATGIADIVVTAQRREQSAQDVPIAITAFSAAQLQAQSVSNALQLAQFVPNLVAVNNTGIGSANAYFLRGLGNTETIATFDPPVGTYVDDIYLSRQNANNLNLFDVERVEVLRGPQGTLFGRNTTGGAVAVILRKAGYEFGGYGEVGIGSYGKRLARGSVDIPLVRDRFAVKVSGYVQGDNGYVRDTTTGERINDDDGWGARLGLRGDLAPTARWNAAYAHIVSDGENTLNFDCDPANPANCDGRFATTGLRQGNARTDSPFVALGITGRKAFYGLGQRAATDLVTSTLEFDIAPKTTLAVITGFVNIHQQFALDFFDGRSSPTLSNPTPAVRGLRQGGFDILNDGRHEQVTQEFKLTGRLFDDRLTYVTGAYLFDEQNRTDFADVFGVSPTFSLVLADRTLRNRTRAYAGYFQGDIKLTDALTVTAGVRYTDEIKTLDIRDNRARCNNVAVVPANCLVTENLVAANGTRIPTRQETRLATPRFAIDYQPRRGLLVFASATRGFKSGGWNARSTSPALLLPFGPEKVWSYEAGVKSDLFDRRLRVNLTAFRLDVTDLQTLSAFVAANGSLTFLTRNFANYRNQGLEAEITVQPARGLNLYANIGYQDDRYKLPANAPAFDQYGVQSVAAQAQVCKAQLAAGLAPGSPQANACAAGIVDPFGNIATPVRTPDLTVAGGVSYRAELPGGFALTPSVNVAYRSRSEVGTSNLTFYTGGTTGLSGTQAGATAIAYPANASGGTFITGSNSAPNAVVNASLALTSPGARVTLIAECVNCLDKARVESTLANFTYLNPPRTYMVRARYNF